MSGDDDDDNNDEAGHLRAYLPVCLVILVPDGVITKASARLLGKHSKEVPIVNSKRNRLPESHCCSGVNDVIVACSLLSDESLWVARMSNVPRMAEHKNNVATPDRFAKENLRGR